MVCYEVVCFEWSVMNRSVLKGNHNQHALGDSQPCFPAVHPALAVPSWTESYCQICLTVKSESAHANSLESYCI